MNETATWELIHQERARLADTLGRLNPAQWGHPSLCDGWSVQVITGHVVAGAEQTTGHFLTRFARSLFRFDVMTDVDARRLGALAPQVLVQRLRATTRTTNHPPAPVAAMLGEIVAHAEDICRPLGLISGVSEAALVETLATFANSGFPLGSKKRVAGLTLRATDVDWSHGFGPAVEGPGAWLMLAMVGRPSSLLHLSGDGVTELTRRVTP
jgi:uncharacterized protein (TIGR03083 family)